MQFPSGIGTVRHRYSPRESYYGALLRFRPAYTIEDVAGFADVACEGSINVALTPSRSLRQLATALTSLFKQGIGIIFIENFFATRFAHLAGPFVILITSGRENGKWKFVLFATSDKRNDYAR